MSNLTYGFVCHKKPQELMSCALAMVSNQKVVLGPKKVGDPGSKHVNMLPTPSKTAGYHTRKREGVRMIVVCLFNKILVST